jgi:hypothetical protein
VCVSEFAKFLPHYRSSSLPCDKSCVFVSEEKKITTKENFLCKQTWMLEKDGKWTRTRFTKLNGKMMMAIAHVCYSPVAKIEMKFFKFQQNESV